MLRKMMVPVIAALVLTTVMTTTTFAAGNAPAVPAGTGQCTTCVDANHDGICDNPVTAVPPRDGTGTQTGRGGGRR